MDSESTAGDLTRRLTIGYLGSTIEDGIGRMLGGVIEAGFVVLGSLVSVAISAAAYRQLAIPTMPDVFQ